MNLRNQKERKRRKVLRVRKNLLGSSERPRLTVFRSLNQVYTQIVDDLNGVTIASASSLSTEIKDELEKAKNKTEKSKLVGKLLAEKAKEKNVTKVVFDRGRYHYHGRIKAVADGAREGGLEF